MTLARRRYWVTFTGALYDDDDSAFKRDDPSRKLFLDNLLRELLSHPDRTPDPAVLTYGSGKVVLAAVIHGPSDGNALDFAKAEFAEAIARAGGTSDLPDGNHPAWQVARLLAQGTVRDITEVAA